MNKVKFLTRIALVASLSSCSLIYQSAPEGWPAFESRPLTGIDGFPPATTVYGKSFRDGCGSAWDAVSRGFLSDVSAKGMDSVLASSDPDYRAGWWDGFEQCTYILDWEVV